MPLKFTLPDQRLQVAALPWRKNGPDIEVLLITSRLSRHWLIPKGWPMKGKSPAGAAAREALEEAGIRGVISPDPVGRYAYDKISLDGRTIACVVDVYPLQVEVELSDWPEFGARERSWMPLETASMLAYEPGLSDLLARMDGDTLIATMSVPRRKKSQRR